MCGDFVSPKLNPYAVLQLILNSACNISTFVFSVSDEINPVLEQKRLFGTIPHYLQS